MAGKSNLSKLCVQAANGLAVLGGAVVCARRIERRRDG